MVGFLEVIEYLKSHLVKYDILLAFLTYLTLSKLMFHSFVGKFIGQFTLPTTKNINNVDPSELKMRPKSRI